MAATKEPTEKPSYSRCMHRRQTGGGERSHPPSDFKVGVLSYDKLLMNFIILIISAPPRLSAFPTPLSACGQGGYRIYRVIEKSRTIFELV